MQHTEHNIKLVENVPHICNHIGMSICSHNVGTFPNIDTLFTKDNMQICRDTDGVYHYKDINFKLEDGWFMWSDKKIKLPSRTEISTFQRVAMSLGMNISLEDKNLKLDVETISFRKVLHVLTMLALKDLKVIPNSFTQQKQYAYGLNVFEAYLKTVSGSGRIKATQKNIRWLNEQDTKQLKADLFTISSYVPGSHSMKYEPTELAEKIISSIYKLFKMLEFKQNDIDCKVLDFMVMVENLEQIRLRDVMLLLSDCIGYDNGFVIRPILTDWQYSRVYGVFTSISSNTRKTLGFHNHDIGAALQTICLQLVEDPSLYPLHQELVNDKIAFRAKIADETGKDIYWVKQELSKANNLESIPQRYDKYPILKSYCREGLLLRKEIIGATEPLILTRATDFAKIKWKKEWIKGQKEPEFIPDGKKESSIFFFIWTQWERQIRESMMSCFNEPSACHQVHDAVYSRQILDPKVIEEKVFVDTGFKVQISTD